MSTQISKSDTRDLSVSIADKIGRKLEIGGAMESWVQSIIEEELNDYIDACEEDEAIVRKESRESDGMGGDYIYTN